MFPFKKEFIEKLHKAGMLTFPDSPRIGSKVRFPNGDDWILVSVDPIKNSATLRDPYSDHEESCGFWSLIYLYKVVGGDS